uniref:MYND-type domain-containing protein n=1 Tax=Culex tarsalis TaxID=7177 RepID=A0A1Q3EWB9_CULTA
MENFNFPPVAFIRPDCPDEDHSDTSIDGSGTTTGSSEVAAAPSSGTNSSESVFQEFTIVGQNLPRFEAIPTTEWLALLRDKADIRRKFNLREADRLQHLSVQLAENDEPDRAMMQITQALYRCPPNAVLEKAILCQKGELLRRKERYQDAIRHLEHCLRIEGERFSFGTYLCLLRCYKAMGNVRKVRTTLARCATFFNRWKDEFQRYDSQLKNEPDVHMEEMKKEFDLHANCIPMEMVIDKSFRNEPAAQDDYEEEIDFEPYLGYTQDSKILGASAACRLDVEGQSPKLVANVFIPEGSIVLVERPLVSHVEFSKVQCYTCHDIHPHLIPCFNCQGVFYCSYQCQGKDANLHRFECRGYQLLFFPLVNGNLELRMLVRTLDTLQLIQVDKPLSSLKSHRTAEDLYRLLLEGGAAGRERFPELFNALLIKLDYAGFRPEDFDALMIKTEKLLSYVRFDGRIKSHYFSQWKHLDESQLDVFLGGLLLHFCTLTMTKVNRLSYNIPATDDFLGRVQDFITIGGSHEEQPLRETLQEALEQYVHNYAKGRRGVIDTDRLREGVRRHLEMLRTDYEDTRKVEPPVGDLNHQVWTRANVKRLWQKQLESAEARSMSSYDSVIMNHHQRQRAEDMVSSALLNFFDGYFDHFGEIPMCSKTRTFPNTMRAFYPTAMKLKHSCGPNLFFAMISNGLFVARARCDIQQGDELTLNHGPHYKEAPREERREYLRKIYISCDCIECGQIEDHWIRHQRVRCEKCLFNPGAPGICPECLQSKELPWEMELLIQQLQDIELQQCKNHIPQVVISGRSVGGLQMSTASGKRKMEMLKFFERLWQLMFVDSLHNVPLFNNLKEQLDCFANEAIRDAIDDVYELLLRCKKIIDTLFPYMSVQVANEYELVVRRTVKYMLPAKFLGGDMRQVHRTTDLARSMIRHAFTILDGHFLYNDDSYFKLVKVESLLRIVETNLRQTGAQEERDLFFTLLGDVKRPKGPVGAGSAGQKKSGGKKQSTNKVVVVAAAKSVKQPEKPQTPTATVLDSYESKSAFLRNSLPNGDLSVATTNGDHESTVLFINEDDQTTTTAEPKKTGGKPEKNVKRKETGAIPKPSRTTKHHRKV